MSDATYSMGALEKVGKYTRDNPACSPRTKNLNFLVESAKRAYTQGGIVVHMSVVFH